jgi:cytoskeletal protein CcmA (bactofilin family)
MEKAPNAQPIGEAQERQSISRSASLDTKAQFESWLDKLRPPPPVNTPQSPPAPVDQPTADFVVECNEGTECEISFEGVLHLEGLLLGSIRSESGTLVTGPGVIEGDIEVGAAFICALVNGNIRATDRVVLHGHGRVWGNIVASALSVKPGAQFEGDCILRESAPRRLVLPNTEPASEFIGQL